jgi:N-acetyl-anhydromuramyl-L-alanine amidase AmpD
MRELSDYSNLKSKAFWAGVDTQAAAASKHVKEAFAAALEKVPTQEEAALTLDMLFIDSHARIRAARKQLASITPITKQLTKNKLKLVEELWWMDHFTGGTNAYSTINTFVQRNVSTHFVQDFHGLPLYVVPLMHGAWHEPRRNADAVSIEVVNPGALTQTNTPEGPVWNFWAGPLPRDLVQNLPPIRLPKPYRGVNALLPFTKDQIVNSLLLKRIVIAALPGRFVRERMTQHMDWRESKTDMGPLWPLADIAAAAFENDPIPEYRFIQEYEDGLEAPANIDPTTGDDHPDNPQYLSEPVDKFFTEWGIKEVQEFLVQKMHYSVKVDGVMGPKTAAAVKDFQIWWSKMYPNERLNVDGIPGPKTMKAMQSINH